MNTFTSGFLFPKSFIILHLRSLIHSVLIFYYCYGKGQNHSFASGCLSSQAPLVEDIILSSLNNQFGIFGEKLSTVVQGLSVTCRLSILFCWFIYYF